MRDHIIVCGAGDTGLYVIDELQKVGARIAVVEQDPERLSYILERREFPHVLGDATDEETLYRAGIENAFGLCATLATDRDNLFLVITARGINPKLRIVSKAIEEKSVPKLLRAGADWVVVPEHIGVSRLLSIMLMPDVENFLDEMLRHQDVTRFSESTVHPASELVGKTLAQVGITRRTGLVIAAIRDADTKEFIYNPPPERRFKAGDVIIAIGTPKQMMELAKLTRDPFYLKVVG